MDKSEIKDILDAVAEGNISADEAMLKLRLEPFEELDFAKPDLHRAIRQGIPESK